MLAILFHHITLTINSEELNKIEKDLDNYPNSSLLIVTKTNLKYCKKINGDGLSFIW